MASSRRVASQQFELWRKLHNVIGRDERRWDGNPYLKMLASPLRRCIVTQKVLPQDMLVRLKAVRLDTDSDTTSSTANPGTTVVLPDAILHPRFTHKTPGRGVWVTLNREIFNNLDARIIPRYFPSGTRLPPNLDRLVHQQLARRVQQECQILSESSSSILSLPLDQVSAADDVRRPIYSAAVRNLQDDPQLVHEVSSPPIPVYNLHALVPPEHNQPIHDLLQALCQLDQHESHAWTLPQSPATVGLAVALRRLKIWASG